MNKNSTYNNYQHFIITRFNLVVRAKNKVIDKVWTKDRKNNSIQTEDWLNTRFELFETFCLPSMLNQVDQEFIWLVYFDTDTPKKYKNRIAKWGREYKNFRPLFKNSYNDFMSDLPGEIVHLNNKKEFVITTRLDNDDALHRNAVSVIKSNFKPKNDTPINLKKGYCLNLDNQRKICVSTLLELDDGPFVSLIEKTNALRTVYDIKHTKFVENSNIIQLDNEPLWVQVIHESNMSNFMRGRVTRIAHLYKDYAISDAIKRYDLRKELLQQSWYVARKIFPSTFRMKMLKIIKSLKK